MHFLAWSREKLDFAEEEKGQGSVPPWNLPRLGKRGLVEEDNVAWSVMPLKLVNRERQDSETMRQRVALHRGLAAGILARGLTGPFTST